MKIPLEQRAHLYTLAGVCALPRAYLRTGNFPRAPIWRLCRNKGLHPLRRFAAIPAHPQKQYTRRWRLYHFCGFYYPIREVIPIPCNVKKQGDPYGWDNTTIAGIMDRWREYLGHTVNFKTTKKSYKSKKKIKNPESEWVIFENTHEPIWTEAIAEAVKQARQSRRRPTKMGEMGMFSGMMYCADCGSILYQCRATGFRKDQEYYICSGYRKGKQVCSTPHSIRTVILEELILQNLREIVSFARSHENRFVQMVMDMDVKERNKGLAKKRRLLSESKKRITELDIIFKRLYEDNISGKLTDERFHKLSTDYEAEQAGLQAQAAMLREEIEEAESKSANVDRFLSVVRQYTDIPELTPRILHEFVEKIVIHAATDPHSKINRRQEVDIYYKGIGILEMSKVFDSRQK